MSNQFRYLSVGLSALALAAAVPATAAAAPHTITKSPAQVQTQQSRIGGGFRAGSRRPAFGSRSRYRARPQYRNRYRRPGSGFFGGILKALGIAYLFHALFGWGAGGSPLGLLLLAGLILWLFTRRRRRPVYHY